MCTKGEYYLYLVCVCVCVCVWLKGDKRQSYINRRSAKELKKELKYCAGENQNVGKNKFTGMILKKFSDFARMTRKFATSYIFLNERKNFTIPCKKQWKLKKRNTKRRTLQKLLPPPMKTPSLHHLYPPPTFLVSLSL